MGISSISQYAYSRFPNAYQRLSRYKEKLMAGPQRLKARQINKNKFANYQELLDSHFSHWVKDFQNTKPGFQACLEVLQNRSANIIETGTSAWGIDSTRLLDSYVRNFGGSFWTIDIREEPSLRLKGSLSTRTQCIVGDSVAELLALSERQNGTIDFIYLDSFDLDWSDPWPSAEHGLKEWNALQTLVKPGSIVLIDDTPKSIEFIPELGKQWRQQATTASETFGFLPGKGALVLRDIQNRRDVDVLHHGYNLLVQFNQNFSN